ncbi:MAG: gliding motility-associated C-terminal domain-containing protein [Flavobacteriales bacterium]|nr:gliding motility-associated C-terminal domain-containing protein [Flavobacteriales bacterium]MCB9191486.1 gliding motility-associated C-terminal domain-containing protein [Flavobacteriales bacterium]MCB9203888.1 gliding motility-associated C-terminal domain-containing protein [Flavobacteriales bacterium]
MRKLFTVFVAITISVFGIHSKVLGQCGTTPIAGDLIITSNTALSGTYNVSGLFRVDPGVVCSVTPYSSGGCGELVINAANIEVLGDIIGDGAGFSGGVGGSGGTSGNNVGALTGCIDKDNCLVIDVAGGTSGSAGTGPGAGVAGVNGTIGLGPKQQCQNFGDEYGFVCGAGGGGAGGGGSYGGAANTGGLGGNGAAYNSGNFSGMDLAGCASPQAGTGGAGGAVGTTYGTATGTDIDLGSGGAGAGGGGKSATNGASGSAGGAGGGMIVLNTPGQLTVAGTISVNGETTGAGGAGGNGGTTSDCCSDGCNECGERTFSSGAGGGGGSGGGSGGGILIQAFGVANITGTLRSSGGNGTNGGAAGAGTSGCTYSDFFCGSNSGSANAGSGGVQGGGGSGGRIKIFTNPCQANTLNASVIIDGGNGFGGSAADGTYHEGDFGNIVAPTLSSSSDSVSCFGLADGQATVVVNGGTAPFTYSWNDLSNQTTPTASNLPAGTYEVTVVDSNQCEVVATVVVPQPDTLTAQVFGTISADCFGFANGEASVMGMGGTEPYSYAWNDPGTQITQTATNLPAGDWVVEITDANGCMATDTATIGQPQPFAASVVMDQSVACFGESNGQATVTANGINLTYAWNDPLLQTTATASNLPAGTWSVTVSSSQTCDTTLSITITEPDPLVLIAVENQAVSCNGGSDGIALVSQLGGTGPFTYLWDDPNLQTTASATGLEAGIYNVVVTDANLCTATASVAITEASAISIAVAIDSASCNGSSDAQIFATVSGGTPTYTYEWNPGAVSGNPLTGIPAGSYSLTVTDANNCVQQLQNILVPEPTMMQLTLVSQEDVSCFGLDDGSAEISAAGGTPPYTYLWNDPTSQSTALAGNLPPGTYNVDVTDANGCMAQWLNVVIDEPDTLIVEVTSTTPLTCDYSADGIAESQVTGGIMPYSYLWNDPDAQTSSTAMGLDAGDFTVVVTDANGCTASALATIDPPLNPLVANFSLSPDSGLQPVDITVTNLSEGGTAYEWIFGDGNTITTFDTLSFQHLYADSGSFDVTLIAYNDITGCSDTLTLVNGMYVVPTSELVVPNVITPNGDGINDMFPIDPVANDFFPFSIRNIYDFKGQVYNRWGEKVYEWTQPLAGWEGRSTSGLLLEAGTYYYVITAKGIDSDSITDYELKGYVTLIK